MEKKSSFRLVLLAGVSAAALFAAAGCPTPEPLVPESPPTAKWARTVEAGADSSIFYATAADADGNVYAAGFIQGTGSFSFGNGVTVTGTSFSSNVVLVKYDSSGVALWARARTSGSGQSYFASVALDSSGNPCVAGFVSGTQVNAFGNGATAQGAGSGLNALVVKYDASGAAQWASTTVADPDWSYFSSVAVDQSGNVFAVGYISGTEAFDFGNAVSATGTCATNNMVIVKYNSNGVTQWAASLAASPDASNFRAVEVDAAGNPHAVGYYTGTGSYDFGNNVTVQATNSITTGTNAVLVKYSAGGVPQWARTVAPGPSVSAFSSVAIDSVGSVYVTGTIVGSATYGFGNSATATGSSASGSNAVLVKYDTAGSAQWAKSVTGGAATSTFASVSVDSAGNAYAVGTLYGTGLYDFGDGATASGTWSGRNPVLVKYSPNGSVSWAQSINVGPSECWFSSVSLDASGAIYAAGEITGTGTYDFDSGITAQGTNTANEGWNVLLVKY